MFLLAQQLPLEVKGAHCARGPELTFRAYVYRQRGGSGFEQVLAPSLSSPGYQPPLRAFFLFCLPHLFCSLNTIVHNIHIIYIYIWRERELSDSVLFLFIRTGGLYCFFLFCCCWENLVLFPVAVWPGGFHAQCPLLATSPLVGTRRDGGFGGGTAPSPPPS